jgi:dimethylamine monooxygenase subunit A
MPAPASSLPPCAEAPRPLPPPWLAGPARFDVGLKPIEPAAWLMPDDQAAWLPGKAHLLDTAAAAVLAAEPHSLPAQHELLRAVRRACGGAEDAAAEQDCADPLAEAARLVSDDLVLLEPDGAGSWRVMAACLCAPTFFTAAHALGGSLGFLHGPVPGGDPQLAARIARVFTLLRPGQVLERHNWTVQWGARRHTPSSAPWRAAAAAAPVSEAPDQLVERVERQTICKLPETGALVFTIRIRLTPLALRLADAALRPAFETAWYRSAPEVRAYKGWDLLERHVAHLLALEGPAAKGLGAG